MGRATSYDAVPRLSHGARLLLKQLVLARLLAVLPSDTD